MKVVVAIDSLKGSLTSMEAGNAIKEGILRAMNAEVFVKPLADGGEGTTEALVEGLGGKMISRVVKGPLEDDIEASYGYLEEKKTAIIEMASAAGITLVEREKLDPFKATTFGVGELIEDAIKQGCRNFIIGIGGSATNDGGLGMLMALGYDFLDIHGNKVPLGARGLADIKEINSDHALPELSDCNFIVACDVTNPLCGSRGATCIYGPQKGVLQDRMEELDAAMEHFAEKTGEFTGCDFKDAAGAGAAGGMGFAFLSYLKARLLPGIEMVMEAVNLEECMEGADFVVTGEGRLDGQTAMGKAPVGVAKLAVQKGAKVIALAGSVTKDACACNEQGISAFFPILPGILTLEQAMEKERAAENMRNTAEQVFRLIGACVMK